MTTTNTWTFWLSSTFGAGIVALAVVAGWRAAPATNHAPGGIGSPVIGEDLLDGRRAHQFETHYDSVFPVRSFGVNVWGAIDYLVFDEGRPGVIVGRHDWLFSSEELTAPPGAAFRVEQHLDAVGRARAALAARGIGLVVALVPAKARVYREQLGSHAPDVLHRSLYDHVLADIRARGVAAPDLFGAMLLCKHRQPVFLRTDTHWTPAGADCAAREVMRTVRGAGLATRTPRAYHTTVQPTMRRGDLVRFLALDPYFKALEPDEEAIASARTALVAADGAGDGLLDDGPAPQVALVGTSYSANPEWNFAGALQQRLGEDVASYAVQAEGPFRPMADYLAGKDFAEHPPRFVIWEMPERYFPMEDGQPAVAAHPGETS